MPAITRSSEMKVLLEGLFFLDDDVIEMASKFYTELKSTIATFGEATIERLIPHIGSLLNKLNDLCKDNSGLLKEANELREELFLIQEKYGNLNASFKDKATERSEVEDHMQGEINEVTKALNEVTEENKELKASLMKYNKLAVDQVQEECDAKLAALTAERKSLLTTIEVLEADVRCLRAEVRKMEQRARRRRSSAGEEDLSLMAELSSGLMETSCPALDVTSSDVDQQPLSSVSGVSTDSREMLLIGDSLLRYSSEQCMNIGVIVECCPGAKILDIKNRLLDYLDVDLATIYFHVGTNNLRKGYRGGPGYNGGHGKREALHDMADLLYTARTRFPHAQVFLNSVLIRRDLTYKTLNDFNSQLDLMCNNFNVEFVEANRVIGRRHLARDGVHLNRRGVSCLASLLLDVMGAALQTLGRETGEALLAGVQDEVTASASSGPGCGVDTGDHGPPHGNLDTSRMSGN